LNEKTQEIYRKYDNQQFMHSIKGLASKGIPKE